MSTRRTTYTPAERRFMVALRRWRSDVLLRRLPWVREVRLPVTCEGYRWSRMSLRDSRDPVRRERHRCRNAGYYRFTALRPRGRWAYYGGRSGTYCWSHLMSLGLYHDPGEEERFRRWLERHEAELAATRPAAPPGTRWYRDEPPAIAEVNA